MISVDQLQDVFLKRHCSAYVVSASFVTIVFIFIIAAMHLLDAFYVDSRVSDLLRTLATVQLTTLAIIFSLTVAGIQFTTNQLPSQVSNIYFQTPIFKLTIIGLVGGAILELATDATLPLIRATLGSMGHLLFLSAVFSIGLYSLCLLVIYILTFPKLMSVQSLLEHFKKMESTEDGLDATVTAFRGSVRDSDLHKGERVAETLWGFIDKIVNETTSSPAGMISPHLARLFKNKLPKIVNEIDEKSEFHGMVQKCYAVAIRRGVICGSVSAFQISLQGIKRLCISFDVTDDNWVGYWNSFNRAVQGIEEDIEDEESREALGSLPDFHRDLFVHEDLVNSSPAVFNQCSLHLIDTHLCIYRAFVFNFESQIPPVVSTGGDIWIQASESLPLREVQDSLVKSLQAIYDGFSEFDSSEIIQNPVAPPLDNICTIILTQWGREATVPMLSLYFESAYLYSELSQIRKSSWETSYKSFVREGDIDPNNPLEILDWYDDHEFELQFLTFDPATDAAPQQEYKDWLTKFLDDID